MRDQIMMMHTAQDSRMLEGIARRAEAMLFEGASFVFSLGVAYLAVFYGIQMPTLENVRKSNP